MARLDALLERGWPWRTRLGGVRPADAVPGWPLNTHGAARCVVVLEGRLPAAWSRDGRRRQAELGPGEAIHGKPQAWMQWPFSRPVVYLGLVFQRDLLRVLIGDNRATHPPRHAPERTRWHHTRHPLRGPGAQVLAALNHLPEHGEEGALESELLRALVRLARHHLAEDAVGPRRVRGGDSWPAVQAHLREHFAEPIGRVAVARAFGLHPNYLSTLCRQRSGKGFNALVRSLRVERACHLLRQTKLRIAEVARASGWQDADHFGKQFRAAMGCSPRGFRLAR